MRKKSPAGPRRLGAIPTSNVLDVVSSTNRIALTGMISNKQINPIHPNSRFALPLMSLSVLLMAIGLQSSPSITFCLRLVEGHIVQPLGLLGNNIGVLDLYSRYDAPNRISNSRSSYTFT